KKKEKSTPILKTTWATRSRKKYEAKIKKGKKNTIKTEGTIFIRLIREKAAITASGPRTAWSGFLVAVAALEGRIDEGGRSTESHGTHVLGRPGDGCAGVPCAAEQRHVRFWGCTAVHARAPLACRRRGARVGARSHWGSGRALRELARQALDRPRFRSSCCCCSLVSLVVPSLY
ncbi:unnamed protein product, partial [Ixodes persulcatus]